MSNSVYILHESSYGQCEQILTKFKKQNGHQITKLSITCSFLELQSPDFAWKFVWTVRTNFDFFFEKQDGRRIAKLIITHSFIVLHTPDFAWKCVWTVPTNYAK